MIDVQSRHDSPPLTLSQGESPQKGAAVSSSASTWTVGATRLLRKAFSFPVFLGALLVAGAVTTTCWNIGVPGASLVSTGDTWWHIVVGKQTLSTRTWPTSDIYSFTASGHSWIANEWLGEVIMAKAERVAGPRGLVVLLLVLTSTLILLLYYSAYLRSRNAKAAAVACALLLPDAAVVFTLRPQLLGYCFLVITLISLERFRQGGAKSLWIVPAVFLLWVNTHGSFLLGLVILGAYWAGSATNLNWNGLASKRWTLKQRRQLGVTFFLCVLTVFATPYGPRLAGDLLRMVLFRPASTTVIPEWQPLHLVHPSLALLLLFLLVWPTCFPRTYAVEEIGLLLLAVYAAGAHQRFLILFVAIFAPLLAALFARWAPPYEASRDRYAINAILIGIIAVALLRFVPSSAAANRMVATYFPSDAVAYLRGHPAAGPMFNECDWGGYLLWSLGPEHRIFIDGRAEMYEQAGILPDYLKIIRLDPDTPRLLGKYGINSCLIVRDTPLDTYLAASQGWRRIYEDRISTIFVRQAAGNDLAASRSTAQSIPKLARTGT